MSLFSKEKITANHKFSQARDFLKKPLGKVSRNPAFVVLKNWVGKFNAYHVTSRAAEISYYLMLAIFPFLIFLISLFGLIGSSTFIHQDLLISLRGLIPDEVFKILENIVSEIAGSQNFAFLSASMIGVMLAASKGFSVILRGLNHIYHTGKPMPGPLLRLLGLLFTVLMVLAIVITMILITFGDLLFEQLANLSGLTFLSGSLLQIGRYFTSFLFLVVVFSLLYYLVSRRRSGYLRSLPAAAFTALSWLIFSFAFSWYLANFNRYTTLYGSLGGIMILMLWLYFCSIMILTGGIIHEMIIEKKQKP